MKYFIDTEFIEGFTKSLFGKRRHFIDLISIGIYCEDGRVYYAISNEYDPRDADGWVQQNVIVPMYIDTVHGDMRNHYSAYNFQLNYGKSNKQIAQEIIRFCKCQHDTDNDGNCPIHLQGCPSPQFYAYFADYDWVVFCSLFGRMIDLPEGFPMYCRDLKQMLDESIDKVSFDYYGKPLKGCEAGENLEGKLRLTKTRIDFPKQTNEHNALDDAKWNYELYKFIQKFTDNNNKEQ